MIKRVFLFIVLGMFLPNAVRADVSSISFLMGKDQAVRDIQTSLTSDTMALTAPIIEPDGSITDPDPQMTFDEEVDAFFGVNEEMTENESCEDLDCIPEKERLPIQ